MLKTIAVIGAVVATSALVVPTVSQAAETNSVRVSYADLNLASTPGQRALEGRIAWAATKVCAIEDSRELWLAAATKSCRKDAVDNAAPAFQAAVAAARHGTVKVMDAAALIVTAP